MMDVRPIRNDEDLRWALGEVERYFVGTPARGTPEGDRFDVLTDLIEAYEDKHHSITCSGDAIDVLQFAIEDMGRSQSELAELLGSRSRASEILNRKRPLTVDMIRTISRAWHLPAELLLREKEPQAA